ncbi:5'-AMP-activated protein kinase subunit gamma-2 [Irineochytrium annulatum]|nr:5'-AMP-activated protein kinase subunit gamma-2 [Irineochytrium annulatum]
MEAPVYDLLPRSSKLVILDKTLLVKKALAALAQHGVQSAPLWETSTQTFAGMLTVTDFINLLIFYNNAFEYAVAVEEFNKLSIQGLRGNFLAKSAKVMCEDIGAKAGFTTPIRYIHPMSTISDGLSFRVDLQSCKVLLENHIHRIALVDKVDGNESIVSVISQFKILRHIATHYTDIARSNETLEALGIGTISDTVASAKPATPLIDLLNMFISKHVSAIPILDENDVYERYDVLVSIN